MPRRRASAARSISRRHRRKSVRTGPVPRSTTLVVPSSATSWSNSAISPRTSASDGVTVTSGSRSPSVEIVRVDVERRHRRDLRLGNIRRAAAPTASCRRAQRAEHTMITWRLAGHGVRRQRPGVNRRPCGSVPRFGLRQARPAASPPAPGFRIGAAWRLGVNRRQEPDRSIFAPRRCRASGGHSRAARKNSSRSRRRRSCWR